MKNHAERERLLQQLEEHPVFNEHEARMRLAIIEFVRTHEDCFERTLLAGHVTGSAWIVSPDCSQVLLTHHAKLHKWLQPGGHADGDGDILRVALREAREESGLTRIRAVSDSIFDVDAHVIPARKTEPEHVHYDIRFLIEADLAEPLRITPESKELAWVPLDQVQRLNTDESVLRLVAKTIAPR